MATIITNGATSLSTGSGFYRVEAANLGQASTTTLVLTSTRTISLTYANTGNALGVVIALTQTSSTTPDRDVTVTLRQSGVSRATATLTAAQITNSVANATGTWITPFTFSAPYAISTSGGVWTIDITQGSGSVDWRVATSNGTAPFYAAWCDNVVSFTTNDCVIAKDVLTLDATATVRAAALATGDSTRSLAMVACTSTNPAVANVGNLVWDGTASRTLTVDGCILIGAHGGFRAGSSGSPISLTNQGKITFSAPTLGTQVGFMCPFALKKKASIIVYGEIPAVESALLANNYSSTSTVVTDVSTGWLNGDSITFAASGNVDGVIRTLTSDATGTSVPFTAALNASVRYANYPVFRLNKYGFVIENSSQLDYTIGPMSNFTLSGVRLRNMRFLMTDTSITQPQDDAANTSARLISHCSAEVVASQLIATGYIHPELFTIEYLNMVGGTPLAALTQSSALVNGGAIVKNCIFGNTLALSAGMAGSINSTPSISFEDNYIVACNFNTFNSLRFTFKNNRNLTISSSPPFNLNGCFNAIEWSGNYWDGMTTPIALTGTNARINMVGDTFGSVLAVTNGVVPSADTYQDVKLTAPIGFNGVDSAGMQLTVPGSHIWTVTEGGVANKDINYTQRGIIYRTGYGLPDTNILSTDATLVQNATSTDTNGAIRLESYTATLQVGYRKWDAAGVAFVKTTGNSQGKNITVIAKVYIPHADFYAGTHTKPTLSVVDNDGTTHTSVASGNTNIQTLSVSFTPATTNTSYSYEIYGGSAASGTTSVNGITVNRKAFYVLAVDAGVPSGNSVDNTRFGVWDEGQVQGADSTIPTNATMWTVPTSAGTAVAGSMGELLGDSELPNLLIKDKLS